MLLYSRMVALVNRKPQPEDEPVVFTFGGVFCGSIIISRRA